MRFNRNDENYVYGFVGKNIKKYRKMRYFIVFYLKVLILF